MRYADIAKAGELASNLNWMRETRHQLVAGKIRAVQLQIEDDGELVELDVEDYEAARKLFLESLDRDIGKGVKCLRQLGVEGAG